MSTTMSDRVELDVIDASVVLYPAFFIQDDARRLFVEIRDGTQWQQEAIRLFGRSVDLPRLTAWYGDPGAEYAYSGIRNIPVPWTSALLEVKNAIEPISEAKFNSVLLNRYRTGSDSVSWHSDDEPEFGKEPVIASVSFGGTRTFQLRHKKHKELKASIELTHGSLLIMRAATQANWVHRIPKTTRKVSERINLTFRLVHVKS